MGNCASKGGNGKDLVGDTQSSPQVTEKIEVDRKHVEGSHLEV